MAVDANYSAPTIIDLGTIAELTLGGTDGGFLDATFVVGTPKGDLTFS